MALVDAIASQRMFWKSLAIERMADFVPWKFGGGFSRPWLLSQAKESNSVRTMADERAIAADESTATSVRHVSMACFGTGNWSIGTRGVFVGGGAVASSVRTGICRVARTSLRSKKEVERVKMSPICSERCLGSRTAR